jgi:diacylglycerol kinase family enzyme
MEKIAILLNPSSRRGKSGKVREKIERILIAHDIRYDLFVSESEAHLKQLAVDTAGKYEALVGVGGDTTFNILVRKLLRSDCPFPVMGMIGTGSANDIVRSLGIHKIKDACAAIKKGSTISMDIGCIKIKGKSKVYFFLGSLSVGLATTVNRFVDRFQKSHKIISRIQPFYQLFPGLVGIYDSFSKKKLPLRVEMQYQNGSDVETVVKKMDVSLLVILNTPYYANGLKLGKNDGCADGILDCCIIDTRSFWDTFRVALKIQRGTHTHCHQVEYVMSPSFKVFSEQPLDLLADGEIIEKVKEFEVSLIRDKIRMFSN